MTIGYPNFMGSLVMSNKFIEIDRSQPILLPQNMEGWLNENDLAYFVVEIMNQIDTSELEKAYKGGGSDPYPPKMMLAMLFYCYANRIFPVVRWNGQLMNQYQCYTLRLVSTWIIIQSISSVNVF